MLERPARTSSRTARWARLILYWGVPPVILALFLLYLWSQRARFGDLLEISWLQVAGIAVAVVLSWLANATQNYVLYRSEGIRIGYVENFCLFLSSMLINYLPMRAGTLYKLKYLKAVHRVRYARQGSYLAINLVIVVGATGLLGLIGVAGLSWSSDRSASWVLPLVFAGMLGMLVGAQLVRLPVSSTHQGFVARVWRDFSDGFGAIRRRPEVTATYGALVLVQLFFLGVRLYLSFRALGIDASVWQLAIVVPSMSLVNLLSITPGYLGVREAVVGSLTLAVGEEFSDGVFAATVDRVVLLLATALFGTVAFFYTWRRLRTIPPDRDEPPEALPAPVLADETV